MIERRRASDKVADAERERQQDMISQLESEAVRITTGEGGRCFVMADGRLLVLVNEPQPGDGDLTRLMAVLPVTRADAEDFFGLT